ALAAITEALARRPHAAVAPLAGDALRAGPDLAPHRDAAADAGAEDDAEHDALDVRRRGAEARLGEGEAVGVVVEHHAPAEARLEIGAERPAVEADRVRVLDEALAARDPARHADAER